MSRNASSQPQSLNTSTLTTKSTTSNQVYIQTYPPLDPDQPFFYADPPVISHHKDAPRISPLRPEYYPQTANMMTHRDLGYGFMPQAVPSYSAQLHYSSLAGMSSYHPGLTRQLSTSPNPGYLPNPNYPRYSISVEDRDKSRRKGSTEQRRQTKLLTRKANTVQATDSVRTAAMSNSRLPNVMGNPLEESPVQTSPDDIFTTQSSLQAPTYSTDHYVRTGSYEPNPSLRAGSYEPNPSLRGNEYPTTSLHYNMPQQAMSSPPYPTAYTMASLSQPMPSLAPPPLMPSPSSQHTYPGTDRSSPILTTPIQGPMSEPIMIDTRRDKPQCWEHGCNGREFSTFSNLLRHQREKSGSAAKAYCPRCGAEFTRTTARNGHMEHGKCKSRRASVAGNSTVSQSGSISSATGSIGGMGPLR